MFGQTAANFTPLFALILKARVLYQNWARTSLHSLPFPPDHRPHGRSEPLPMLPRNDSTSEFQPLEDKQVEYFFASDASAVIEHTNRVIFLEVSRCNNGAATIGYLNILFTILPEAGTGRYDIY